MAIIQLGVVLARNLVYQLVWFYPAQVPSLGVGDCRDKPVGDNTCSLDVLVDDLDSERHCHGFQKCVTHFRGNHSCTLIATELDNEVFAEVIAGCQKVERCTVHLKD